MLPQEGGDVLLCELIQSYRLQQLLRALEHFSFSLNGVYVQERVDDAIDKSREPHQAEVVPYEQRQGGEQLARQALPHKGASVPEGKPLTLHNSFRQPHVFGHLPCIMVPAVNERSPHLQVLIPRTVIVLEHLIRYPSSPHFLPLKQNNLCFIPELLSQKLYRRRSRYASSNDSHALFRLSSPAQRPQHHTHSQQYPRPFPHSKTRCFESAP
mmetsp:Transcript_2714/g.6225  ORF Transcript_2714/g.6225 Transcript_2714/m.6225 type:complete len:212 (+) Transcript_2714:958-1593(+)